MNHCCEPNAYSRVVCTEVGGAKRIIIFAARRLHAGEEVRAAVPARPSLRPSLHCSPHRPSSPAQVLYDYNFQMEDGDSAGIECHCGATSCRGLMN